MFDQHLHELESLMKSQVHHLDELMEVLRDERLAIVEYDLNKILETSRKKNSTLTQIQSSENQKKFIVAELCRAMGLQGTVSLSHVLDRISDQDRAEEIRRNMSSLKSLAQAAQEFNAIQHDYIAHSLSHIQTSLSLYDSLQGRTASLCYDKKGSKHAQENRRKNHLMMNESI